MPVRARHLDRAFNRLGARVTEESPLQATGFAQFARQRSLVFVVVKIGGMDQQGGLVANHFHNARVRMAQCINADSRDQIEVPVLIDVIEPAALAAGQYQRVAGVILQEILLFQVEDRL